MKVVGLILGIAIMTSCTKQGCKENVDADCICTMQYDPVCGCNDVTYSNPCMASCSGIENYTAGSCK